MKLNLFVILFAIASIAHAQTAVPRLIVWQKSGEKVVFELADLPETTFESGQLVIRSNKTTVSYPLASILRYTYEEVGTGIDLLPNEHSVLIDREGNTVTFRNLKPGSTVSIYGANGLLVDQSTIKDDQPLTVSIANRPSGVYIVKAGTETIKLLKK